MRKAKKLGSFFLGLLCQMCSLGIAWFLFTSPLEFDTKLIFVAIILVSQAMVIHYWGPFLGIRLIPRDFMPRFNYAQIDPTSPSAYAKVPVLPKFTKWYQFIPIAFVGLVASFLPAIIPSYDRTYHLIGIGITLTMVISFVIYFRFHILIFRLTASACLMGVFLAAGIRIISLISGWPLPSALILLSLYAYSMLLPILHPQFSRNLLKQEFQITSTFNKVFLTLIAIGWIPLYIWSNLRGVSLDVRVYVACNAAILVSYMGAHSFTQQIYDQYQAKKK